MSSCFSDTLSALRRERNISQRQAASELGISQALLSHYENGLREPRLDFVVKVCDYYGVTADYMLGREETPSRKSAEFEEIFEELRALSDKASSLLSEKRNIKRKSK